MEGFVNNDGGRADAGFKGKAGDCVCRAIAIATEMPYIEVYNDLNALAKNERTGKRKKKISSAREGVYKQTYQKYLAALGWKWVPTMRIGQGCKVHLDAAELPKGRIIIKVSRHLTVMIDGVIHDTHDPRRTTVFTENGAIRTAGRCVYGYFVKETAVECPPETGCSECDQRDECPVSDPYWDDDVERK